eukprot:351201-Chlamydomonas_euryale.AAC.4
MSWRASPPHPPLVHTRCTLVEAVSNVALRRALAISGRPSSSASSLAACWHASTSVGASSSAWWPAPAAASIASIATTVLPLPTSPCSRRVGRGGRDSSRIFSAFAGCVGLRLWFAPCSLVLGVFFGSRSVLWFRRCPLILVCVLDLSTNKVERNKARSPAEVLKQAVRWRPPNHVAQDLVQRARNRPHAPAPAPAAGGTLALARPCPPGSRPARPPAPPSVRMAARRARAPRAAGSGRQGQTCRRGGAGGGGGG